MTKLPSNQGDTPNKLEDILLWLTGQGGMHKVPKAEAAIKTLILEMVGEVPDDMSNYGGELLGRYQERAELREKILKEL